MGQKRLIFKVDENQCITPISHKLNQDGYFRKRVNGKLVMYHRHVWEKANGPIPEGFEVNHKCHNRACCNLEHLELLEGTEHAILTNIERSADRLEHAKRYWQMEYLSRTSMRVAEEMAVVYGVNWRTVYKWFRRWKV